MAHISTVLLVLLAIQQSQAVADTQTVPVVVGGTPVLLPIPPGFREASDQTPEAARKAAEGVGNRLLAYFITESDLALTQKGQQPDLRRYAVVQVLRKAENTVISDSQFREAVEELKRVQGVLGEKAKDAAGPVLNDISKRISKDPGSSVDIKLGEMVPLGVITDRRDAFGLCTLTKLRVSVGGSPSDHVIACGMLMVRARNHVIYGLFYSRYDSQEDVDWVHDVSTAWADKLSAANPTSALSEIAADKDVRIMQGCLWGVIKGCLVLVVLGLIGMSIRALRRKPATVDGPSLGQSGSSAEGIPDELRLTCPKCQTRISESLSVAGTVIHCPKCGQRLLVRPPPDVKPPPHQVQN